MAEAPIMPFMTDAYLGDTVHLTTTEHGAYLLLLITMWRNGGGLPEDHKLLARYSRMTPKQFARVWPVLESFFYVEDGQVKQGKLTETINAVRQKSKKASDSARAKWRKTNKTCDANASDPHSERYAKEPDTDKKATPSTPIPPNRFDEFWSLCPVKSGKPAAKKNFDKAIKAGHDPQAIIDGMKRYAEWLIAMGPSAPTTKYPQGWLTDERWSDELPPIPQQNQTRNTNGGRDGQLASLAGWATERFGNRAEAGTGMAGDTSRDGTGSIVSPGGGGSTEDDPGGLVRGFAGPATESHRDGVHGMAQVVTLPAKQLRNPFDCSPDRDQGRARPAQPALALCEVVDGSEHDHCGVDGRSTDGFRFAR